MKSTTLRYTIIGAIFGFIFPVLATIIWLFQNQLGFSVQNFIFAQKDNLLLWIIDSAPFILGALAFMVGRNQTKVNELNSTLHAQLDEREKLVTQLQNAEANLEDMVTRRVNQLTVASQVAQRATAFRSSVAATQETLLNQTARLVSEQFGYYHVGIFLTDSRNEYAVLQAASSEGGQRMLTRGHKLRIGEIGIVGHVAAMGKPRIALDVGADAVFFNNPDLPKTRSEVALPISRAGSDEITPQVIGVLDIQTTEAGAFDEIDIIPLQIIADSLASAIENANLFVELQHSLEEIRSLHGQYLRQAWLEILDREGGFEYTYRKELPLTVPDNSRSLEVPIKLRAQTIGMLTIEAEPRSELGAGGGWLPEEIALAEGIAAQAALAMESTRLLNETQRLAEQERISARVSSRIWASSNTENILQTALEELGNALQVSEGLIQLEIVDSDGSSAEPSTQEIL